MHSPTILLMLMILLGIAALSQLAIWYFNRHIHGLGHWAGAYAFALLSSANLLFRSYHAEILWVVSSQLSQFFVAYLIYAGIRSYLGLPALRRSWMWFLLAALVVLSFYFTVLEPVRDARIIISSLVTGVLFVMSAKTIATGGALRFPARYLFSIPCAIHGLFALGRIPYVLQMHGQSFDTFNTSTLPPLLLIESTIALVMMSFGTLMLANEHITNELRRLAETDTLTGIFNRRSFMVLLNKALSATRRFESPLSILLVDLDHFKKINDTWGHKQGDVALGHFVTIAMSCLRGEDVLGRMGGEEFAVFLPNTSLGDARAVAERLRARVAAIPLGIESGPIHITISVGVVQCRESDTPEDVLHRADSAMYRAKENGRNRVEISEDEARH